MKLCLIDAAADFLLAVPSTAVVELCRELPLTPAPLCPPVLAGVANLRGEILPVFRSSRIFPGAEEFRRSGVEPQVVVLQGSQGRFGLRIRHVDLVQLKSSGDPPENAPDPGQTAKKTPEKADQASQEPIFLDVLPAVSYRELPAEENASASPAGDYPGIYGRTLEVENRGTVRELDLPALSQSLQESLMAFDVLQTERE